MRVQKTWTDIDDDAYILNVLLVLLDFGVFFSNELLFFNFISSWPVFFFIWQINKTSYWPLLLVLVFGLSPSPVYGDSIRSSRH